LERLVHDLVFREPEVGGRRVGRGGLDCELDVGILILGLGGGGWRWVSLDEGGGGRGGDGEAAGLGDVRDVDVEPLAGEVAEGRLLVEHDGFRETGVFERVGEVEVGARREESGCFFFLSGLWNIGGI
jgi:hypothetical protein